MSFTCQALPDETTVTVYWPVMDLAGCVDVTCWLIVTRKVIDVGLPLPKELIESIVPLPVDTCLSAARGPATPGVP